MIPLGQARSQLTESFVALTRAAEALHRPTPTMSSAPDTCLFSPTAEAAACLVTMVDFAA